MDEIKENEEVTKEELEEEISQLKNELKAAEADVKRLRKNWLDAEDRLDKYVGLIKAQSDIIGIHILSKP